MKHYRIVDLLVRMYLNNYEDSHMLDNYPILKLHAGNNQNICLSPSASDIDLSSRLSLLAVLSSGKLRHIFEMLILYLLASKPNSKTNIRVVRFIKANYSSVMFARFMQLQLSQDISIDIIAIIEDKALEEVVSTLQSIVFDSLPAVDKTRLTNRLGIEFTNVYFTAVDTEKLQFFLYNMLECEFPQTYAAINYICQLP